MDSKQIENLLAEQLQVWESARNNYVALGQVKTKELNVKESEYKVQFNPARIVSSGAKVDAKSIQERKCFLCAENRPSVQEGLSFTPNNKTERNYTILINPFPIFPKHFTIPDNEHVPQRILNRFEDMLDLAKYMDEYVVFYNGPKCGASAPDHVHFQAGNKGFLPIEKTWDKHIKATLIQEDDAKLHVINYGFSAFVLEAGSVDKGTELFNRLYEVLPQPQDDEDENPEPMMNILAWYENEQWISIIIPRAKHRPDCYFAEGDKNILISPASVDLGGVFITPLEKDFNKITEHDVAAILSEVCLDEKELQAVADKLIN